MSRRLVLYSGCGVAALIAAGVGWAWSGSRSPPVARAPRAAAPAREHPTRSLPSAPTFDVVRRAEQPPAEPLAAPEASGVALDDAPSPSAPSSAAPTTLVPDEPAPDDPAATEPHPRVPSDTPEPDDTPEVPARAAPAPPQPREVSLTRLRLWSQPGMCGTGEGLSAREALGARFQYWDGGEGGQFHIDPRLPLAAATPILGFLAEAEREVARRLKLSVARPETFVYFDKQLLTAAACINSDVAAYYDGALHVVAADADLRASVLHEYTHHALISSGLLGPAWAQEGIAMNIAGETWWQTRRWYSAILDHPFGIDDLDESIPYQLVPDQAVQFYAQSAALVACVLESKRWGLDALFNALRPAGTAGDTLRYDLPEVGRVSFLRSCLERWQTGGRQRGGN
jgi:hypothetical protein